MYFSTFQSEKILRNPLTLVITAATIGSPPCLPMSGKELFPCIHALHSQYQLHQSAEEKEEILQLIEMIFYSSERTICLDRDDPPCDNISAELGTHVSSLYSAASEHVRAIVSRLHSTAGNVQKVPGLPCSNCTRVLEENKTNTPFLQYLLVSFAKLFIYIFLKSSLNPHALIAHTKTALLHHRITQLLDHI